MQKPGCSVLSKAWPVQESPATRNARRGFTQSAHELKAGGALEKTPRLTSSSQSSAQTSLPLTCEHMESPIFSFPPAWKRLHLSETYNHFSGTERKDTSGKEVLLNPLQLQARANQERN